MPGFQPGHTLPDMQAAMQQRPLLFWLRFCLQYSVQDRGIPLASNQATPQLTCKLPCSTGL